MKPPAASRRGHRARAGLFVGLACWGALSALFLLGLFEALDTWLLDAQYRLRGPRQGREEIAIVAVDDETIRAYGTYPLPRDQYALLIAALERAGARAVGFDIWFAEDSSQPAEANLLLAASSSRCGSVTHSLVFDRRPGAPIGAEWLPRHAIPGDPSSAPEARGLSPPFEALARAAPSLGHLQVQPGSDGVVRALPLVIRYRGRGYPSLGLAVYGAAEGNGHPRMSAVRGGGMRLVWPNGHAREWQVSRGGSTAIDFAGSFDAFRHVVPMIEVLRWYRDGDSLRLRAVFRGRAVLVGTASRTEAPGDLGPTPLSPVTPMIFVHANVLDNLYRGHFLRTVPSGVYVPAMGVVGAGLGAAGVVLSLPAAAVVLLVGGLLIALVGQAALVSSALSIPLSLALLLPVTVLAAAAGLRYSDALRNVPRPLAANPRDDVDRRFGDYVLKEFVAHGGMGLVYRAWSRSRKGHVAIKLMRDAYRAKPEDLRRFRRETEALRRLRHPNIAALLEHGHSAGIEYIAMEFVQGVPLARLVERGPIEQRRALEIGVMICSALVEAHGRGIIHRDIKPSNVMVQEDGVAKLLDFGLAQILDPGGAEGLDATARWNRSGTGPYIAPEIFLLHPYDHRIDIYGVGQLLFEMLTGRRPFQETDPGDLMSQVTGEPPPRPRVLNASIRPEIEYIVLRCLAKWPDERFQTAGELLQRLQSSAGWFPR